MACRPALRNLGNCILRRRSVSVGGEIKSGPGNEREWGDVCQTAWANRDSFNLTPKSKRSSTRRRAPPGQATEERVTIYVSSDCKKRIFRYGYNYTRNLGRRGIKLTLTQPRLSQFATMQCFSNSVVHLNLQDHGCGMTECC